MKKKANSISIRWKLFLVVLLVQIPFCGLFFYYSNRTVNQVNNQLAESQLSTLNVFRESLETQIKNAEDFLYTICWGSDIFTEISEAATIDEVQSSMEQLLDDALERILALTDEAFENDDTQKAAQVEPLEEIIDVMVERLRDQHIRRLKDGVCSIDTGVVFLDVLNNAERISDHCSNIAVRMVGMEAGDDYDSHTLKNIMHHSPSKDYMLEYEQCRKEYLVPLEEMEA